MRISRPLTTAIWRFAFAILLLSHLTSQATAQDAPLRKVLDQFTSADAPASGPSEAGPTTRSWWDPTTAPSTQPAPVGNGIAQHPMLYAGEGYNTLFLVNGGKGPQEIAG